MKRFFSNIKKHYNYMCYAAFSELKSEVANSYLGWIWWVLEPLCFMLIYVFIAKTVFHSSEPYFEIFVFIGLAIWNFFSKVVLTSVKLVKSNSDTVTKVYIPKYILLIIKVFVNLFKLLVGLVLVLVFMLIFKVPFHFSIIYIILDLLVLTIVTFGCAALMLHLGVFIEDLYNVTNIGLRLVFYLSGVFFAIRKRVPAPWGKILVTLNPIAFLINESRQVLIYNTGPNYKFIFAWLVVGVILSVAGVTAIHKYENTYVKVMKP